MKQETQYRPSGTLIAGQYEIVQGQLEKRSFEGGMGVVHLCVERTSGDPVALKTFQPQYLADRKARDRFLREGDTWVRLGKYPNIVRCYDVVKPASRVEVCARKPRHLPVVMTRAEVKAVLTNLSGDKWLVASPMCGAGLRLMKCLHLRVQDVDFSRNEILVRDGKGAKDRITMPPESFKTPLRQHLIRVKAIHERNILDGWGACNCRWPSTANIPSHLLNGAGSGFSRRSIGGRMKRKECKDDITRMNPM
jgi:integrase